MKNICMIVQNTYPADARVRREVGILEKAGYKIDVICLRGVNQEKIERMNYDLLVGPKNDSFIKSVPTSADVIIATGKPKGELSRIYERRKIEILSILENRTIYCVGDLTKSGHPRHGRMWNLNNRDIRVLKWN